MLGSEEEEGGSCWRTEWWFAFETWSLANYLLARRLAQLSTNPRWLARLHHIPRSCLLLANLLDSIFEMWKYLSGSWLLLLLLLAGQQNLFAFHQRHFIFSRKILASFLLLRLLLLLGLIQCRTDVVAQEYVSCGAGAVGWWAVEVLFKGWQGASESH